MITSKTEWTHDHYHNNAPELIYTPGYVRTLSLMQFVLLMIAMVSLNAVAFEIADGSGTVPDIAFLIAPIAMILFLMAVIRRPYFHQKGNRQAIGRKTSEKLSRLADEIRATHNINPHNINPDGPLSPESTHNDVKKWVINVNAKLRETHQANPDQQRSQDPFKKAPSTSGIEDRDTSSVRGTKALSQNDDEDPEDRPERQYQAIRDLEAEALTLKCNVIGDHRWQQSIRINQKDIFLLIAHHHGCFPVSNDDRDMAAMRLTGFQEILKYPEIAQHILICQQSDTDPVPGCLAMAKKRLKTIEEQIKQKQSLVNEALIARMNEKLNQQIRAEKAN